MLRDRFGQLALQVANATADAAFEVKMCAAILLGGDVLVGMDRTACAVGLLKAAEQAALAKPGELTVDGAFAHQRRTLLVGLTDERADLLGGEMAVGIGLKQRQHRATSGGGVLFFHGNLPWGIVCFSDFSFQIKEKNIYVFSASLSISYHARQIWKAKSFLLEILVGKGASQIAKTFAVSLAFVFRVGVFI